MITLRSVQCKRVHTRNYFRWHIPWVFTKATPNRVLVIRVCFGSRIFVLRDITTGNVKKDFGDNRVKFGEDENYWHWCLRQPPNE